MDEIMGKSGAIVKKSRSEDEEIDVKNLPPGFRFHPTDEEIVKYYLTEKVMDSSFNSPAIGEADFNKCEPWDLAMEKEKECYFYWKRDRKYPTGMRTNRATEAGYWKATGKDREIYEGKGKGGNKGKGKGESVVIGMKKTLVFYRGRAPKGDKTNWIMHEFRLFSYISSYPKDEWVVCRVFHKKSRSEMENGLLRINSFGVDDMLFDYDGFNSSLPPLIDHSNFINNNNITSTSTTTTPTTSQNYSSIDPYNNNNHIIPSISWAINPNQGITSCEGFNDFPIKTEQFSFSSMFGDIISSDSVVSNSYNNSSNNNNRRGQQGDFIWDIDDL